MAPRGMGGNFDRGEARDMQIRYIGMNPRQMVPALGVTAMRGQPFKVEARDVAKQLLLQGDNWEPCDAEAMAARNEAIAEAAAVVEVPIVPDFSQADAERDAEDAALLGDLPALPPIRNTRPTPGAPTPATEGAE